MMKPNMTKPVLAQIKNPFFLSVFFLLLTHWGYGQDTLPEFKVTDFGNKRILINWVNNYPTVKQISIQRSKDSTRQFTTILTVPDPMNRDNGFMDTRAPDSNQFYRLFIVTDGGNFTFSRSRRPVKDTTRFTKKEVPVQIPDSAWKDNDVTLKRLGNGRIEVIADSGYVMGDQNMIDKNKPKVQVPTNRVTTNKDGYVRINIKDFDKNKYGIRFYEDDDTFLFEIKEVKQGYLVLDKSNFYHAGWFRLELYENDKMVEKYRVYVTKEY